MDDDVTSRTGDDGVGDKDGDHQDRDREAPGTGTMASGTGMMGLRGRRPVNGEGVNVGYGLGVSVDKCVGAPNIIFEINASVTKGYR